MKKRVDAIVSAGLFAAFILLIMLLKTVDVGAIGPADTCVGLSGINGYFRDLIGTNDAFYLISKLLGIFEILIAALLLGVGAFSLFRDKSFKNIPKPYFYAMCAFALLAVIYLFFEIVIINYRPILEDGASYPEASFPSSHTMLAVAIMGVTANLFGRIRLKDKRIITILKTACIILAVITVAARFLSGVHWFTDICGGILIGLAIVFAYRATQIFW